MKCIVLYTGFTQQKHVQGFSRPTSFEHSYTCIYGMSWCLLYGCMYVYVPREPLLIGQLSAVCTISSGIISSSSADAFGHCETKPSATRSHAQASISEVDRDDDIQKILYVYSLYTCGVRYLDSLVYITLTTHIYIYFDKSHTHSINLRFWKKQSKSWIRNSIKDKEWDGNIGWNENYSMLQCYRWKKKYS